MARVLTRASELVAMLQKVIEREGDLEVVMVAPWAGIVDNEIDVLSGDEDYLDGGATFPNDDDGCVGKICLDACG